jgi:Zn finger protein HypA/HybF involved in hydrogenase expression
MYDLKKLLSKYRECQDCKHKFILTNMVLRFELNNLSSPIYCPVCESNNTSIIPKEEFLNEHI